MQPDEREVVGAARSGDQAAWEVLYRRLYPRIHAYLARRVGAEHADDAVSETMTRAVNGIDGFTLGASGFDGWVFGIARRVAADHHRKAGQLRRQDVAAVRMAGGADLGDLPGDGVLAAEDKARLRAAFARLGPADQEVLELRVIAGLTTEQVAEVLSKEPGAVRTAQSRALARLRRLMESDGA